MGKFLFQFIILFQISFNALNCQTSEGIAAFYHDKFDGQPTANGEIFSQKKFTAAHRELPFGTMLQVTNLENKKSVVVRVNDRGPFVNSRLIDVSKAAAESLDFLAQGVANVKIEVLKTNDSTTTSREIEKPRLQPMERKEAKEVHFPNEYYELDIKFAQPVGFAIQVASFTELSNLLRMAQELQRTYGKNLLVQVSDYHNKKVHRLLVGPYVDRPGAEKMQKTLNDAFPGSFVVELK